MDEALALGATASSSNIKVISRIIAIIATGGGMAP
jgi:hypothetical protein